VRTRVSSIDRSVSSIDFIDTIDRFHLSSIGFIDFIDGRLIGRLMGRLDRPSTHDDGRSASRGGDDDDDEDAMRDDAGGETARDATGDDQRYARAR